MIINLLMNIVTALLGVLFSWLPTVQKLPDMFGYDIDTALVNGMSQFNYVVASVWILGIMFQGFLIIMAYYLLKMTLKFFLGGRAPAHN